jgi:chemotaxis receptor (MCP) glutamine deamidase CheD
MLAVTPLPARTPSPVRTPAPAPARPEGPAQPATYVHPGRLASAAAGGEFTTVVGSGVVACVWDPVANVAGMAHFLLPEKGSAPAAPRFGDVAMAQLLADLAKLGGERARLRASVFGGSAPPIATGSGHLGERNVEAALAFFRTAGITVVQKDVGGTGGRKVIFLGSGGFADVVRLSA